MHYKNNVLDFIQHAEGRYQFASSKYQYDLKDHLGNVRATVQRNSASTTTRRNYGMETSDSPVFPTNGTTTFVSSPKRSGSRSVQIGGTSASNSPTVNLSVNSGDIIAVSVWVTSNYNNGQVKIDYHNSSGTYVSTLHTMFTTIPTASADASVWFSLSKDQLVAPGNGTVRIYLQKPAPYASVFYDDLTIAITGNLPEAGFEVVQRDDYYPFGGRFNSHTSGAPNNYLFNGTEYNSATDSYETLFRGYDPWLGRFTQIDPMADFFPGINPYNFAFNNPILLVDPDGLGPIGGWLKKLVNGFVGDGASQQARRSQRKNDAVGGARSSGKGKGSGGSSSSSSSSSSQSSGNDTPPAQHAMPHLERKSLSFETRQPTFPDIQPIPIPEPYVPTFRNKSIPAGSRVSFNENISFIAKTDKIKDQYSAELKLNDLISVLQANPALRLHVVGNATIAKSSSLLDGNSDAALDQGGFTLNGNPSTARGLMNSKADAIRRFLMENGIDGSRITIGPGNVIRLKTDEDLGIGGKVGFTIMN